MASGNINKKKKKLYRTWHISFVFEIFKTKSKKHKQYVNKAVRNWLLVLTQQEDSSNVFSSHHLWVK